MTTKTLGGFPHAPHLAHNHKAEPKKNEVKQEPSKPAQKEVAKKTDGRYQNSFAAEKQINRDYKKTFSHGDTSDLFTPNAKPSKVGSAIGGLLPGISKDGSFDKHVTGYQAQTGFSNGIAQGNASVKFGELAARGQGHIGIEGGAFKANGSVEASATLVHAEANFHMGKGDYNLDAHAMVDVGAKAHAAGELTIDPAKGIYAAKVGGEAFAGARAVAEAKVNLGKFGSAGGKAEAWAGVGASFNAELGVKNGRFKAKFEIGAALGIGFKLGFNIDIDLKGIKDTVKKVISKPVEALKSVGKAIGGALKKLKFW